MRQSTSRPRQDTNPLTPRILLEGTTSITTSSTVGSGVQGTTTVDLSLYQGDLQGNFPTAKVWRNKMVTSGNTITSMIPGPYVNLDGSGNVNDVLWYELREENTKGGTYGLYISFYQRGGSTSDVRYFAYKIYTELVPVFITGTVAE